MSHGPSCPRASRLNIAQRRTSHTLQPSHQRPKSQRASWTRSSWPIWFAREPASCKRATSTSQHLNLPKWLERCTGPRPVRSFPVHHTTPTLLLAQWPLRSREGRVRTQTVGRSATPNSTSDTLGAFQSTCSCPARLSPERHPIISLSKEWGA